MKAVMVFVSMLLASQAFAAVSPAEEKKFQQCQKTLIQAQKLGVLYNLDWKPPKEPYVVVGRTFDGLPIDGKENFALTVNCFLMAGKKQFINFNVLDWRTGKPVGRFSYGQFKVN